MKKTFIQSLIGTLLLFGLTAKAAEIKGVIICKDKAVSFANIIILATKIGTQADEDGKFTIKNAPNGKQTIQISSVGYKTKQLTISILENKITNLNIEIEEENAQLNEVVITGTMKETTVNESPAPIQILNPTFFRKCQFLLKVMADRKFHQQYQDQ